MAQQKPRVLPADFNQWDEPAAGATKPRTLPADFNDWDEPGINTQMRVDDMPEDPEGIVEWLGSKMPSWRTALRVGGQTIGGAVGTAAGLAAGAPTGPGAAATAVAGGALGGAAGSSIGESLWQLAQHLRGSGPKTTSEALAGQNEAMLQGAIGEGVGAGLATRGVNATQRMLRGSATRNVANAVRPSAEGARAAVRESAEQLVDEFPVAATQGGLLSKVESRLDDAALQLERAYNAVPQTTRIHSTPIVQDLGNAITDLTVNGKFPPGTEAQVNVYRTVLQWFRENPRFTIDQLRRNKQIWDSLVNYYRGSMAKEPAAEQAWQHSANAIRRTIGGLFPQIDEANKTVSAWTKLAESLRKADTMGVGNGPGRFGRDLAAGAGGELLGSAVGLPPGTGASSAIMLRELMDSAAWQSAAPQLKVAAIRVLETDGVRGALELLTRQAVGRGGARMLEEQELAR